MKFNFLNVPVTVQPSFWVYLFIFCFDMQGDTREMILMAMIFTLSLLFHEYGHALAAIKFRRRPEITLEALGGYASYPGPRLGEKEHFIVILAGPLFTALLIGLSYYLLQNHVFSNYWALWFCYWMMKLNTYWLILNLVPLRPLDGGQMLEIICRRWGGKGEVFQLFVGNVSAALGAVYFLMNQNFVFALLFLSYGLKNFQASQGQPFRRNAPSLFAQMNEGTRLFTEGDIDKAEKIYRKLIRAKDLYIKNHSLEGLASVLEQRGKIKEAYELLLKANLHELPRGKYLFWKLAYLREEFDKVTEYSTEIYALHPTFETALLNAKAFAGMRDTDLAIGWLNTAMQFEQAKNIPWEEIALDPAFSSLSLPAEWPLKV